MVAHLKGRNTMREFILYLHFIFIYYLLTALVVYIYILPLLELELATIHGPRVIVTISIYI